MGCNVKYWLSYCELVYDEGRNCTCLFVWRMKLLIRRKKFQSDKRFYRRVFNFIYRTIVISRFGLEIYEPSVARVNINRRTFNFLQVSIVSQIEIFKPCFIATTIVPHTLKSVVEKILKASKFRRNLKLLKNSFYLNFAAFAISTICNLINEVG